MQQPGTSGTSVERLGAPPRLSAVVTTYRPDPGVAARFIPLLGSCEHVFVVDNTPGGHRFEQLPAGFSVIQDGANRGLGSALNRGILAAQGAGADYVVLFDQDSTPSPDAVRHLLGACVTAQGITGAPCAVGPTHVDDISGTKMERRRLRRPGSTSTEVSCLTTSGLLFPVRTFGPGTLFASDLFLDLVDFEWCWRMRRAGWRFLRAEGISLLHRQGIEERRWLGLRFHVPAPYRHYYQFRDTLRLAIRRYVPLYSRLRLAGLLPLKLLVYPFILDDGRARLHWMVRGTVDAMRGVTGVGAASSELAR